jgi:glycosyltransferase involved in cell wall biosynthesis
MREADGGMDNLPTVIMEAMAAGLPVISTPLGGIPEMVEHEVNGELVPERDPTAICAALERMISDPERARRLGDKGRQIAREKFSIERSGRELRKLFEEIQGAAV